MREQFDLTKIFYFPDESSFYSYCVEILLFKHDASSETVIEFGSGDGLPVIEAMQRSNFHGVVEGYEINEIAYHKATSNITQHRLSNQYVVHHLPFEEAQISKRVYLIANPPYLPAPHDKIRLPFLFGGNNGTAITKKLFELDFHTIVLILSSYSCPEEIIHHAIEQQKGSIIIVREG